MSGEFFMKDDKKGIFNNEMEFRKKSIESCYLAAPGFESQVIEDLKGEIVAVQGQLILSSSPPKRSLFSLNIWQNPQLISFASINEAAKALKSLGRNWALYPTTAKRRSILIQEKLPYVSKKPLSFPTPPLPRMGSWTLLSDTLLLASPSCTSPFPNGEPHFLEDKIGPPSRAYLKLYEALTLIGKHPKKGEKCLEIGASPGSWTFVLTHLGAHCLCCDRAPLEDKILHHPLVDFRQGDAFNMTPEKVGKVDWIFSDVICYPDKLLEWAERWLESGYCNNFVLTIKLQGEDFQKAIQGFDKIQGGRLVHLFHNKHELTFLYALH